MAVFGKGGRASVVLVVVVGVVVLFALIGVARLKGRGDRRQPIAPGDRVRSEPVPGAIPGLTPADVYSHVERRGLKRMVPVNGLNPLNGHCERREGGVHMMVQVSGTTASSVEYVGARATRSDPQGERESSHRLFVHVAMLPYEGSRPTEARGWVNENFGRSATTTIGGVTFRLASGYEAETLSLSGKDIEGGRGNRIAP